MKYAVFIVFLVLPWLPALAANERGTHRISATRQMEIIYLSKTYALLRGPWNDSYSITEAKYEGEPDVAEFTGDVPGKELVVSVKQLCLFKHAAAGRGYDPGTKSPPQPLLYFIVDLNTGHTKFYSLKSSFRSALLKQFGIQSMPTLYPPDKVALKLARISASSDR